MPKVTAIPTALLREDNGLVDEGDMLSFGERQVRLCGALPNADGLVTVQETFQVSPEQVGLHLRPGTVILELTDSEAAAVLGFYHGVKRGSTGAAGIVPEAGDVLEALDHTAGGK
jgi:hypothetical protein